MEKVLSRILLILNIVLIVCLLALSGLLIYTSAAKPAEVFGHTAVLTEGVSGGTLCIVDRHPAQLLVGDRIVYRSHDNTLQLATIKQNDGTTLTYLDNTNHLLETTPDDEQIQGLVTSENVFLGHFLSTLSDPENSKITYVCIGVGFIFCAIAIFLAYFISSKVSTPILEDESDFSLLRSLLGEGYDQADGGDDEEESDEGYEDGRISTPFPQLARVKGQGAYVSRADSQAAASVEAPSAVRNPAPTASSSLASTLLPDKKAPLRSSSHAGFAPRVVRAGSPSVIDAMPDETKRASGGGTEPPTQRPVCGRASDYEEEEEIKVFLPRQQIERSSSGAAQSPAKTVTPSAASLKALEDDFSSFFNFDRESSAAADSVSSKGFTSESTASVLSPGTTASLSAPRAPEERLPSSKAASRVSDAYDLYDVITPNIDDMLSDIEKEFNDLK